MRLTLDAAGPARLLRSCVLAVPIAGALGCGGAAAQVTAQEAASLQATLRGWFAGLLAPALTLPEPPLTVTPDGDSYRLSLPVTVDGEPDAAITAALRAGPGTGWTLDALTVPPRGTIIIDDARAQYEIGGQSARLIVDPTLTSRSTLDMELRDLEVTLRAAPETQEQSFERYRIHGTLIPGADGRIDLVQDATFTGWELRVEAGGQGTVTTDVRRGRLGMRLEGLSRDSLATLFGAARTVLGAVQPNRAQASPALDLEVIVRDQLRVTVGALRNLASRFEVEESFDDFTMKVDGLGEFSIDQLRFALGGEAPDGRLRLWSELAVEGLDIDGLPPGLREFVPSRIGLRPVVTGVSTERLLALMTEALGADPDDDRLTAEAAALLTTGGASIGVEGLVLEVGGLQIEGAGRLRMLAPGQPGIEARLAATGVEAMMKEANRNPELRPALPVLALLRGIARQEGERLVWELAITADQALVNGIDVATLQLPPDPPPQRRPRR